MPLGWGEQGDTGSCEETRNGDHHRGNSIAERYVAHAEEAAGSMDSSHYTSDSQRQMKRVLPGRDLWDRDIQNRSLILDDRQASDQRRLVKREPVGSQ